MSGTFVGIVNYNTIIIYNGNTSHALEDTTIKDAAEIPCMWGLSPAWYVQEGLYMHAHRFYMWKTQPSPNKLPGKLHGFVIGLACSMAS